MSDQKEVRVYYTGDLLITSEDLKRIRFEHEMKEHFRQQRADHELRMAALKIKQYSMRSFNPIILIPIVIFLLMLLLMLLRIYL